MKNVISVLAIVACIASCTKKGVKEQEENGSFSTANRIDVGIPVTGSLATPTDRDYFVFSVDSGSAVDIVLSPLKGINHALTIYRSTGGSGELMKMIDDARKSSEERIDGLRLSAGEYYVLVSHGERDEKKGDPDALYTLQIINGDYSEHMESEPNDTFDQCNSVDFGIDYTGFFSPAMNRLNQIQGAELREDDVYCFDAECSDDLPLILDIDLTPPSSVNPVLELYSPEMKLIGKFDAYGKGEVESISGRGFTVSGRYYIVAYAKGFESSKEKYTLRIEKKDFDPAVELEPNNSFEEANTAPELVKGRIYPENDLDFYYYQDTGDGYYSIELLPPSDVNLKMKIFDRNYKQLYQVDAQGAGMPEIFPNFRSADPFYISVYASGAASDEEYYTLSVKRYEQESNFESEPNDDIKKANPLNGEMKGYISYAQDKDYFLMTPGTRKNFKFKIKGIPGTILNASVTDQLGFKIREVAVKYDTEVKFNEIVDGKGYLIIESEGSPSMENYSITVE